MKLCAVSPFTSASESDILDFIGKASYDLIVLPGASSNSPDPAKIRNLLQRGVRVFLERKGSGKQKHTPLLVTQNGFIEMPRQVFESNPSAEDMKRLARAWSRRTFSVGTRAVTVAICGEILGFNPDGTVKHGRELPFDVLVNPAHSKMGRWHHLGKKLANLSRGTIVVHIANNDSDHSAVTTDVRMYRNGKLLRNRQCSSVLAWCEGEI